MLGLNLRNPQAIPHDRARVVETYGGAVPQIAGVRGLLADKPPMRQSVLLQKWKLIQLGPDTELYNLQADPAELVNLAKDRPEHVAELASLIEKWSLEYQSGDADEAALNDDDMEALESLGYLD